MPKPETTIPRDPAEILDEHGRSIGIRGAGMTERKPETTATDADSPESILLYGIETIAKKSTPQSGGGFSVMSAISANYFANEILLAYWKAKAGMKAA